jgi:uncharacterized membrane protein
VTNHAIAAPATSAAKDADRALRMLAAGFFVLAGVNHFIFPAFYAALVPPWLPAAGVLSAAAGVAEIAGGLGLLVPRLRRAAGWGLIALLIAVFPANVHAALHPDGSLPPIALYLRLPFQAVFIAWVWRVALKNAGSTTRHTESKVD